jgi:hypothetical protein
VIDLDVAPPPRATVTRRPSIPLLLSLAAVFLLLGASAPRPRPAPGVIIPATFRDDTFVDGNRLFVINPAGLLRIFRLPDAHLVRQIRIRPPGPVSEVRQAGEVLLITTSGPPATEAVDAGSGRPLWSAEAHPVSAADGLVVLTDDLSTWAVDSRTGTVRWRLDQPVAGSRYLVNASFDGMTAFDGRTGAMVATAPIHLSGVVYSYLADDRFVIGDSTGLTAYRLPSLTALWHVATPTPPDRLEPRCVQVLCYYTGDQGVTVRDPATGRTLWSSPRWATVAPLGADMVAAADSGPLDAVRLTLLDPATGRIRGDFDGWHAIDDTIRYALHPASTRHNYWFGAFDPAHASVRIIGEVPQMSGSCLAAAGALVYHRIDGSIAVWRFG